MNRHRIGEAGVLFVSAAAFFYLSACDSTGPDPGLYEAAFISASGARFIGANESAFDASFKVTNYDDLGAEFEEWSFRVLENDRAVFEIDNRNWTSYRFYVVVNPVPAASGKTVYYFFGNVTVMSKYWTGSSDDTIVYLHEDGDIYQGARPNRILFTCRVRDENGNTVSLQASGPFDFSEKD